MDTGRLRVQPRFRVPDRTASLDDPIKQVAAAVQAVLAESQGRSQAQQSARSRKDPIARSSSASCSRRDTSRPFPRARGWSRSRQGRSSRPLARDMLKRLGVTIRLGSSSHARMASARGEWAFAIEIGRTGTTQALRRALLDDPRPWAELESSLESWSSPGCSRSRDVGPC